jgi:two-component system, NarL family, response regulator YdfI
MRAFIVTSSPLVLAGLENILTTQGVEVAGTFSSLEELSEQRVEETADVVLVDATGEQFETILESIGHFELTSEFEVILLADRPMPASVAAAIRAGIGAILPTNASPEQLVAALQGAVAGLVVLARGDIVSTFPAADPASRPLAELAEPLTRREREVLQMLASGLGNKEIATRLAISEHTVKFHVASILGKLGAASRTEAVTLGIRHGLVLL